jgi:hypothetical protein
MRLPFKGWRQRSPMKVCVGARKRLLPVKARNISPYWHDTYMTHSSPGFGNVYLFQQTATQADEGHNFGFTMDRKN